MAKATQATKPGKAIVPAKRANVATVEGVSDEMLSRFIGDSGKGLENTTAQDFALPFILLLQSLSPEVDEDNEKHVAGAKPGMFLNTVTKELLGTELTVIPCSFEKVYNEWVPRDQGGGFVKSHADKQEANMSCGEGHQIVDTANHYVLIENGEEEIAAILSLTSTKLKASRNWLSRISQVLIPDGNGGKKVAPSFARKYVIKSVKTKNDKGTFFIIEVEPVEGGDGWVSAAQYDLADAFRAQLTAGKKGADYAAAGETVAEVVENDDDDDDDDQPSARGRRR